MKPKFIRVNKATFWIAINNRGDPVPHFGFTFWKKQMQAKLKKENYEGLVVPIVFMEAQNHE